MVKLIGYEWRKHFLKKSIIAAMLLFSALNVAKIYSVHEGSSLLSKNVTGPAWKELYWKMYEEFSGTITDEKIEKLMAIYRPLEKQTADLTASTTYRTSNTYLTNVYEDWNFFRFNYVNPMKYAYDYKAYAHGVVTAAKDNMGFYESIGNSYEYQKNAAIAKLFQGRSITSFSYTEMYKYYVQYDFSAFLALLICLYGLMSVFLSEKETEMDTLLLTTKAGGVKTVWAKLMASVLFVVGVCFWFWIVDFVSFSVLFGSWDAASSPLYVLEDFIHASLNVSLGQYAVLSALVKTAGMLVFALAFLLISCLFRNALIPFIAGLFTAFGCIYLEEAYMGSGRVLLKIINPFVLVVNRELFRKAEFVPLMGYPLPSYIAALLFAVAWGVILLCAIMIVVRKNALRKGGEKSMSLWMYEMKKMFLLQKGLLFIGLYFVLNLASMMVLDKPANPDIEMNASQYLAYLNQVQGPYSEETERFFSDEAAKISSAKVALQKVTDDYYDGNLEEQEFLAASGPLENILQNEKGFQLIYDQYTYIRENPANRYFLYTNGWDGLLSNDSLDFLWLLLLLLLIAPVFGFEYESRMDALLLTVKKGTRHHAIYKIGLALLTVAVLCLLNAGLRYGFYQFKYGLENGHYPLQSLSYFGTSTKNSTLFEAFLWVTAGKLFGSLCFAILILFASVWLKKYAATLFSSTAVILLPYYGMHLESSKYFLPGPLGFMISTGFLRGNEYKRNPFKDQLDVVFREVSLSALSIVFAVTLCLSIAMLVMILIRRTNVWSAGKRKLWRRASRLMLIFCMAMFVLSGCTSSGRTGTSDIYNYSSRQSFENERYRFYVDQTDLKNIRIVFEDKKTGDKGNFVRNPMPSLTRVENNIYGNGMHVYYMKYDFDKSGFKENINRFSVIEVDTTNFQERIVFEKKLGTGKSTILGLVKASDQDWKFFTAIDSFFLDEHSFYFIGQGEIRRVDRLTGDMRVILRIPVLRSVAFDGRTIYYINEKSQVVKYDTKTDSETVIPDLITRDFVLTDTELLFLNRKDQQKIYALDLRDSTFRKITDVPVQSIHCDGQSIFYVNKEDLKQYRIDRDGQNDTLIQN